MDWVPTLALFFSLCCFLSCKSAEWQETAVVGEPLPLSLPALNVVTSVDSVTEPFSVSHGPCFALHWVCFYFGYQRSLDLSVCAAS